MDPQQLVIPTNMAKWWLSLSVLIVSDNQDNNKIQDTVSSHISSSKGLL